VHDGRFLATRQQSGAVLEKYRDKLARKARQEGHADIDLLKKACADKAQALRGQEAKAAAAEEARDPEKRTGDGGGHTAVKPLSSMLDLDKARTLPAEELAAVWRLRHAGRANSLCAVIPAESHAAMVRAARRRPQFVLPVPHGGGGAEMHFLQWAFDPGSRTSSVLFTQLAEYKARGEFAQPHTTVTHHSDLAADKGVVLMHGSVADDGRVSADDARWLIMCLQRFYGGWTAGEEEEEQHPGARERALERRRLLDWFATGDERFSVEKLMEEAERLG
jgi:ATP synthase F1 complex assembly factor 1